MIIFLVDTSYCQYRDHSFGLSFSYNYTTSSKLYLYPNSIDEFLRDQFVPLDDINSYSAELRYRISEPLMIGLSAEFISKTSDNPFFTIGGIGGSIMINIKDGYELIPVELSVYYFLPFSTSEFIFYMGGGMGLYFGNHVRQFGDIEVTTVRQDLSYGIHVSLGMDYMVEDFFSIRGVMKFRDPQFEMQSKYNKSEVIINGNSYLISNNLFDSKVNIDGITFGVGVVIHFL